MNLLVALLLVQGPANGMGNRPLVTILVVVGVVLLAAAAIMGPSISLFIQARVSGASVSLVQLIGMRLRKVNARTIVYNRIRAVKAGLNIPVERLEVHELAGGRASNVVSALIAARVASIPLSWEQASAIDLSGRDVLDAVTSIANPKALLCPSHKSPRKTISAAARDGSRLHARAKLTVRANLQRFVGGADEEGLSLAWARPSPPRLLRRQHTRKSSKTRTASLVKF